MKVGIYGGSFNPIHNGHIKLAEIFLQEACLDEVWFMVSPQNPFKINDKLLDDTLRLQLVRKALNGKKGMVACNYEFRLPKPSYTWDTLQRLSADFPTYEFVLLIGGDNWQAFDKWYHAEDILANYRIAVYPRKSDETVENVAVRQCYIVEHSAYQYKQHRYTVAHKKRAHNQRIGARMY